MTYADPSFDYYDEGLVHAHDWSRATPPGQRHPNMKHKDGQRGSLRQAREHDEGRMSAGD